MELKKIIVYSSIITLICVCYVNKQVELVTLGYKLEVKGKRLSEILDQNRILVYNNTCLKAPQYLAGMLKYNEVDLCLPDTHLVAKVRVVNKRKREPAKTNPNIWRTYLLDLLVPQAQAAAQKR
ncbi:MAG: hypothetical protein ABII75_06955 [Candidatus Omnitrophota bacterium]